jgi:manganese/zinc/iron transport system permease protein
MALWHDLLFDYTLRTVALGSAALGITSGALGTFAVLRRQSLLGDTISHAALPGIVLAFLLTGSKAPLVLILGAILAGWLASIKFITIVRTTRLKSDTALGLVLSVFFGFGLVLLTLLQKRPDATQAGLDNFLFGQAAALMEQDLVTMASLGGVALLLLSLFWKEFKLLSFDPDFGASLGFPMRWLDIMLTSLVVIAIVIGLQTVGVVLMSTMIVAPAAAARQWTNRLGVMVLLAALFGAAAGTTGAILSSLTARLPTGPAIVICATILVMVSLLLAPNRGLFWSWLRLQRHRRRLIVDDVLADLYRLASQHQKPEQAPHSAAVLKAMGSRAGLKRSLRRLAQAGLVRLTESGQWSLTAAGIAEARRHQRTQQIAEGRDQKPPAKEQK